MDEGIHKSDSAENPAKEGGAIEPRSGNGTKHPVATVIDEFVQSMRGIGETASVALPHISKWLVDEISEAEERLKKFLPEHPGGVRSG